MTVGYASIFCAVFRLQLVRHECKAFALFGAKAMEGDIAGKIAGKKEGTLDFLKKLQEDVKK